MRWPALHDLKWTPAEKRAARKAFDAAYEKECRAVRAKVVQMLEDPHDVRQIWRIHDYLTEQRRDTDLKYDYRYSVPIFVFATLLREGWLTEDELSGVGENKIEMIENAASFE